MTKEDLHILNSLETSHKFTFAYLTCKRFFPNYAHFCTNNNFGDINILTSAIDFLHNSIFQPNEIESTKIEYFLAEVYNNIPSTNEFPTAYGTIAMYSGVIVYESINLLKTGTSLLNISTTAINIVDCFIQEKNDMDYSEPDFEKKIQENILMQTELKIQKGIISYLSRISHIEHADLDILIELQKNETVPLII